MHGTKVLFKKQKLSLHRIKILLKFLTFIKNHILACIFDFKKYTYRSTLWKSVLVGVHLTGEIYIFLSCDNSFAWNRWYSHEGEQVRTCERNICLRYWSSCGAREPQESQLVAFQQLRNVYGTATEQLRNSYGTATKQLRNSYGTVTFAHVQLSCLSLLRSQCCNLKKKIIISVVTLMIVIAMRVMTAKYSKFRPSVTY